jgi:hypothetical protein
MPAAARGEAHVHVGSPLVRGGRVQRSRTREMSVRGGITRRISVRGLRASDDADGHSAGAAYLDKVRDG